jgi:signal transduction histidine kinase
MAVAHLTLEGLIHDLNNVFQTISEGAELLESDPKWKKLAATLQRSAERGQRIAHGILDSSEGLPELGPVVESAVQFARDYLEGIHGPKLQFESHVEPGMRVKGEAAQWERVLGNLFLNAAEAGASKVRLQARDGEIVVSDNGHGIAPGLLPRIFQPHVSTKSIMSGLGLYVVQSIVEESGGEVQAANGPNGGAMFTIRI